jgi:hypothetical protein
MSLANLYTELHRRAQQSGEDRALDLKGGARIAVRVLDGVTTLTVSRKGKKIGDAELVTFKRDCGVPPDAARYPAEGQSMHGDSWFVAYRWVEGVDQ